MGGGGKSKGGGNVQAAALDTNPNSYVNTGYNATPNPFTTQGQPSWMQGNFAMDSWGKSAADPRISMTQDMLNPYGAPIHNQAVQQMGQYDQQMAQGLNPQLPAWMTQAGGGQPMSLEQAMAMNTRAPVMPAYVQQQSAPKKGKGGGVMKALDPLGIAPGGENDAKLREQLGLPEHPDLFGLR